jgi:hypothetical protein
MTQYSYDIDLVWKTPLPVLERKEAYEIVEEYFTYIHREINDF